MLQSTNNSSVRYDGSVKFCQRYSIMMVRKRDEVCLRREHDCRLFSIAIRSLTQQMWSSLSRKPARYVVSVCSMIRYRFHLFILFQEYDKLQLKNAEKIAKRMKKSSDDDDEDEDDEEDDEEEVC